MHVKYSCKITVKKKLNIKEKIYNSCRSRKAKNYEILDDYSID